MWYIRKAEIIAEKNKSQFPVKDSDKYRQPKTHPNINRLKWATGLVIPSVLTAAETIQINTTGTSHTITPTFLITLISGYTFAALALATPNDMGKSTWEFIRSRITKINPYQNPTQTSALHSR